VTHKNKKSTELPLEMNVPKVETKDAIIESNCRLINYHEKWQPGHIKFTIINLQGIKCDLNLIT
jgi:hypothetical protein